MYNQNYDYGYDGPTDEFLGPIGALVGAGIGTLLGAHVGIASKGGATNGIKCFATLGAAIGGLLTDRVRVFIKHGV